MKRRAQSLGAGAAILLVSAVIVKVIGAFFKVPLTAMIGGEGMGYYMTAYSVFTPIYAVCVAGLPAAISRTAAGLRAQSGKRLSQPVLLLQSCAAFWPSGVLLGVLLTVLAPALSRLVGNPGAEPAIRAVAPAVFLCTVAATLRGLFESERNVLPTAISQCVEASVKLAAGLWLASLCLRRGAPPEKTAAAVLFGVTLSVAAGALCAALFLRGGEGDGALPAPGREVRGRLRAAAVPVCLAALVANLAVLIDLATVMNRLTGALARSPQAVVASHPAAGLSAIPAAQLPNFLFGSYTALAMTVFHLVPALTAPLCTTALPMVSGLRESGRARETRIAVTAVLKSALLVALPAGIGISALGEPILSLLFAKNPQEVAVAARILQPLGIAAALAATAGPVNSLLQAVGKPYAPVRLLLAGTACKAAANLVLIGLPRVNIEGAAWGTLACYAVLAVCGVAILLRGRIGVREAFGIFFPPLSGGLLCAAAAKRCLWFLRGITASRLCVVPAIAAGVCVYLAFLFLVRPFGEEELAALLSRPGKKRKMRKKSRFSLEKYGLVRYD